MTTHTSLLIIASLALILGTSCSQENDEPQEQSPPQEVTSYSVLNEGELHCQRYNYPCSLSETDESVSDTFFNLSREILTTSALYGQDTQDEAISNMLSQDERIKGFHITDTGYIIEFEGAPPLAIAKTSFLPKTFGKTKQQANPVALSRFDGFIGRDDELGSMLPLRALVISPFYYEFSLPWQISESGLLNTLDYKERVDVLIEKQASIEALKSFKGYDFVYFDGHGLLVAKQDDNKLNYPLSKGKLSGQVILPLWYGEHIASLSQKDVFSKSFFKEKGVTLSCSAVDEQKLEALYEKTYTHPTTGETKRFWRTPLEDIPESDKITKLLEVKNLNTGKVFKAEDGAEVYSKYFEFKPREKALGKYLAFKSDGSPLLAQAIPPNIKRVEIKEDEDGVNYEDYIYKITLDGKWELSFQVMYYICQPALTPTFFKSNKETYKAKNKGFYFNACEVLGNQTLASTLVGDNSALAGFKRAVEDSESTPFTLAYLEETLVKGRGMLQTYNTLEKRSVSANLDTKEQAEFTYYPPLKKLSQNRFSWPSMPNDMHLSTPMVLWDSPSQKEILDESSIVSIKGKPSDGIEDTAIFFVEIKGFEKSENPAKLFEWSTYPNKGGPPKTPSVSVFIEDEAVFDAKPFENGAKYSQKTIDKTKGNVLFRFEVPLGRDISETNEQQEFVFQYYDSDGAIYTRTLTVALSPACRWNFSVFGKGYTGSGLYLSEGVGFEGEKNISLSFNREGFGPNGEDIDVEFDGSISLKVEPDFLGVSDANIILRIGEPANSLRFLSHYDSENNNQIMTQATIVRNDESTLELAISGVMADANRPGETSAITGEFQYDKAVCAPQ